MGHDAVDDDEDEPRPVGLFCAACDEQLLPELDDVVLWQVQSIDGYHAPPAPRETEDGEPLYDPLLYCIRCHEELIGDLRELTKDQFHDERGHYPIVCHFCDKGIDFGEALITITVGEVVFSKKRVNVPRFSPSGDDQFMCIVCATQLSGALEDDEGLASRLWEELAEDDECPRCTSNTCWRRVHCSCDCHSIRVCK